MVKHIVIWDIKEGLAEEEKMGHIRRFREGLLNLKGVIEGIIDIDLVTEPLPSSNGALMLVSAFESEKALKAYQVHPAHVEVSEFGSIFVKNRKCMDYEC